MAWEYFSSESANCPFLNSRLPSFFSLDRCGGKAPHGASRLTVSPTFPSAAVPLLPLFWSALTEAVDPLLLVPLATFSLESCETLYLSELPPLLLQWPWWELLDSLCGPPSPLPWGFFWALPMSPFSGAAEYSSPPTGWLGSTGQAERERGEGKRQRRGDTPTGSCLRLHHSGGGLDTHDTEHFKGGVPGSSNSTQWIMKALGGGRVDNTRTDSFCYTDWQAGVSLNQRKCWQSFMTNMQIHFLNSRASFRYTFSLKAAKNVFVMSEIQPSGHYFNWS